MDLQEQRITCLRMAIEMGCKADAVIGMASELMNFVANGNALATAESKPEERSAEAIAACGTALPAAEAIDLALVQPEAPAAAPAADPAVIAQATPVAVAVSAEPLPEAPAPIEELASPPPSAEATEPALAAIAAETIASLVETPTPIPQVAEPTAPTQPGSGEAVPASAPVPPSPPAEGTAIPAPAVPAAITNGAGQGDGATAGPPAN